MSLGTILDVVIGLFFTFLLMAVLASGVYEAIAGWLGLRGRNLRDALAGLLSGTKADGTPDLSLFSSVFKHGLVADLSKKRLPSYVPAQNFALALFEQLKDGSQTPLFSQIEKGVRQLPPGPAKDSLTAYVDQAAGDLDVLRKRVETWFDDAMDRLSGDYKRNSQLWILAIGLAIAVSLNVDTVSLTRTLWSDSSVRSAVANLASSYVDQQTTPPHGQDAAKKAGELLHALPVPIGWRDEEADRCIAQQMATEQKAGKLELFQKNSAERRNFTDAEKKAYEAEQAVVIDIRDKCTRSAWTLFWEAAQQPGFLWKVIGWFITGVAAALGAPYWFALLQQLLSLRNAGPKPKSKATSAEGAT